MRAEKEHVIQTLGHAYTFAQQPLATFAGTATLISEGAQQDEAAAVLLPQLATGSAVAGSASALPNNGMEPSERKLSQAMPCGSVTQYLSDWA